jgi:hypothetical protein
MTSLAELKMHIRDQHLQNGQVKDRVKRHFGAYSASVPPQGESGSAAAAAAAAPATSRPDSLSSTDNDRDDMDQDSDGDPETGSNRDDDAAQDPSQPRREESSDEFRQLVRQFGLTADGDNGDDGDDDSPPAFPSMITVKIADLFNFDSREWIIMQQRSATRSLEEELELYELVDKDISGVDPDAGGDMDDTLGSILQV